MAFLVIRVVFVETDLGNMLYSILQLHWYINMYYCKIFSPPRDKYYIKECSGCSQWNTSYELPGHVFLVLLAVIPYSIRKMAGYHYNGHAVLRQWVYPARPVAAVAHSQLGRIVHYLSPQIWCLSSLWNLASRDEVCVLHAPWLKYVVFPATGQRQ